MLASLFSDSTTLFVVVDPIGSLPLFIAPTAGLAPAQRRRVALAGVGVASLVLLVFIAGGQFLLAATRPRAPTSNAPCFRWRCRPSPGPAPSSPWCC